MTQQIENSVLIVTVFCKSSINKYEEQHSPLSKLKVEKKKKIIRISV